MNFLVPQFVPAFGFTTPMLLWGALLGSIPVVIHLLHKRKYRETPWAAMRFLLEAARKNSRRVWIEQLILLTVRMLILLFLVGALQGMYFETQSRHGTNIGPTHHVIVVDASFSMQTLDEGKSSRFERARKLALRIVDSTRPGDLINLALINDASGRIVISTPAKSRKWVRSRLETEKETSATKGFATADVMPRTATDEYGRLSPTLIDVDRMLKQTELARKRVYLISDFQRVTWAPKSPPRRKRIRDSMKAIAGTANLVLINVGEKNPANTAVTTLQTATPYAILGQSVEFKATVRNFGAQPLTGRSLKLFIDGQLRDSKTIELEANSETPFTFVYPPAESANALPPLDVGEHYVEVRLQDDLLPIDNVRGLSLPVTDRINVLLVDGDPDSPRDQNATLFLRQAMKPTISGEDWQGLIEPRVITESALMGTDLSTIDCVFLCSVASVQQNEARKLQAYAESGGGVIFCMGQQARVANYNAVLFRDGDGVLPAKIGDHVDREYAFRLDSSRPIAHPIFRDFVGNPGAGLESVFCRRYFRLEIPPGSQSRVAMRFQKTNDDLQGDPVIVESRLGQGRMILFATSFDRRSSTWAGTLSFVPMVNELVHFAIAGRWNRRQFTVGEPLERGFPSSPANMPPHVDIRPPVGANLQVPVSGRNRWRTKRGGAAFFAKPPEKKARQQQSTGRIPPKTMIRRLERRDQFVLVRWSGKTGWVDNTELERVGYAGIFFDGTTRRGAYELLLRPPLGRREIYAINVDPLESDPAMVGEKSLRSDMFAGVRFDFRDDWRDDSPAMNTAGTVQSGMTRWLLIAVLCLILVEQLMAWRFLPGLSLLAAFVVLEFSHQAFRVGPTWGTAAASTFGVALAVGFLLYRKRQRALQSKMRTTFPRSEVRR